jgi:hypothetical protein
VAVGEAQNRPFQLSFNSSLKVDFQGSGVTSDGGLVLVRELDERLGFGELIERHLADARGKNTQLPLADTFSGNSAPQGGGIWNDGAMRVTNSILANSTSGGNCSGPMTDGGYNISDDDTCSFTGTNVTNGQTIAARGESR